MIGKFRNQFTAHLLATFHIPCNFPPKELVNKILQKAIFCFFESLLNHTLPFVKLVYFWRQWMEGTRKKTLKS